MARQVRKTRPSGPPLPPGQVAFDLGGRRIPAERFVKAVTALKSLVDEITRAVTGQPSNVRWLVSVRPGSVHLAFRAEPQRPHVPIDLIMKTLSRGIRVIERRAVRPRYFTNTALERLREISDLPDGKEIEYAQIRVESQAVRVSKKAATHVDELLRAHAKDYGTIEGHLQMISLRGSPHFAIYDVLTDHRVECFISEEQLEVVQRAFGHRTGCRGVIKAAEAGKLRIVTSAITLVEVIKLKDQPPLTRDKEKVIREFFLNDFIVVRNVDRKTAEFARELIWKEGLKPKDAIHVATALLARVPVLDSFDEKDLHPLNGKLGTPRLRIGFPHEPEELELPFEAAPEEGEQTSKERGEKPGSES